MGSLFSGLDVFAEGVLRAHGGGRLVYFAESAGADAEQAAEWAADRVPHREIARRLGLLGEGASRNAKDAAAAKVGRSRHGSSMGTLLGDARRSAYCRRVVGARHPGALDLGDVCAIAGSALPVVDVLCLGFPCQDLSSAGSGQGLAGARSGLWAQVPRILGEVAPDARPTTVLIENSSRLVGNGLAVVLSDLAALGYDAVAWQVVGAVGVGAPHLRERVAIVARRDGRLARWPALAPWAEQWLSTWWTPEAEPTPRVVAPFDDPALVSWRIDAVSALGNAVVLPWAEWVATAARRAEPARCGLFGAPMVDGAVLSPVGGGADLPPAGVMLDGHLYAAPRVYSRSAAKARALASPICRLYGRLLPTPRKADHRSGSTSPETAAKNSRPLCAIGALLPTPVKTIATRGDCPGERRRNSPHLGSVAVMLAEGALLPTPCRRDSRSGSVTDPGRCETGYRRLNEEATTLDAAGALLATPTRKGNDNRTGLSERSGDGIATQARAMAAAETTPGTLLHPAWVAWVMGAPASMVPVPGHLAGKRP